jgi:hypothetical protein
MARYGDRMTTFSMAALPAAAALNLHSGMISVISLITARYSDFCIRSTIAQVAVLRGCLRGKQLP